jgi:hypothetical protein
VRAAYETRETFSRAGSRPAISSVSESLSGASGFGTETMVSVSTSCTATTEIP